ncbi:MAG: membrane protein insertase YidC, partial [Bacteroidaceae bacterium]|nr:membrane protein insertase YidC [Bacteroidaceae bacterium]
MIGFALMALVLFGFQYFSQPSAQQIKEKQKQDSIALVERQVAMRRTQDSVRIAQAEEMAVKNAVMDTTALFYPALKVQAKDVVLQNELVKLTIGAKGGAVKEAILKKYNDQEKQPLKLVGQEDGLLNFDLPYSGGTLST